MDSCSGTRPKDGPDTRVGHQRCASSSNTSAMAKGLRLSSKGWLKELCFFGFSEGKRRESRSGLVIHKADGNGGVTGFRRQSLIRWREMGTK